MLASRRRKIEAAVMAGLFLVVAALLFTRAGGGKQQLRAVDELVTTTTLTTTTSTSTSTTTTASTIVETTTTAPPPPVVAKPTSTTLDSNVNQPLHITLKADKLQVPAGETVTITATLSDADATPRGHCVSWLRGPDPGNLTYVSHGDGAETCYPDQECPPSGPTAQGGTATDSFTYTNPGGYDQDVYFGVQAFSSDPACAHNSYAEATITVHLLP